MTHKIKALCRNCGLLLAINRKKLGQFKKTCRRCGTIHEGEIKMSGHDPEEDISTTVAVSFIADLEVSLVRALGQEEEYLRRCDNAEKKLDEVKEILQSFYAAPYISRRTEAVVLNDIATAVNFKIERNVK